MSRFPVLDFELWTQIVYRFQAPSPYHAKQLGLRTTQNLPVVTEYLLFPNRSLSLVTWKDAISERVYAIHDDQCPSCLGEDIRILRSEGTSVCFICGYIVTENHQESSYQESHGSSFCGRFSHQAPRVLNTSSVKRVNHFKGWLTRLQGNERCKITRDELNKIQEYINRSQITILDYQTMRIVLKRLHLQSYYNHVFYLMKHFTGEPMVEFLPAHEEQLLELFHLIQPAFTRHAGRRVNMLSYTYLIKKFSELLEWNDIAWSIPCMKSDANIYRQDQIWKCICDDMGFPFTRSVL